MALETREERRTKILTELPYDILMNPEVDFEPITENLIQKGIMTVAESDKILNGWRMGRGIDKTLIALWNMPDFEHLKGPMSKLPSSQSSYLKEGKPDYRKMLIYYVDYFKDLDYEIIGNDYVTQKRLPQIAVDNILHDWRKQKQKSPRVKSWEEESIFFGGLVTLIILSFFPAIIVFNLDASITVKLLLFCIPIGYAVQYHIIKKQMLKDRAEKFNTLLHSRVQDYPTPPDYDENDEIWAKYIKLKEWGRELQYESHSHLSNRIISIYFIYFVIVLIWSFLL